MGASTLENTAGSLKRTYVGSEHAKARRAMKHKIIGKGKMQKLMLGGSYGRK